MLSLDGFANLRYLDVTYQGRLVLPGTRPLNYPKIIDLARINPKLFIEKEDETILPSIETENVKYAYFGIDAIASAIFHYDDAVLPQFLDLGIPVARINIVSPNGDSTFMKRRKNFVHVSQPKFTLSFPGRRF